MPDVAAPELRDAVRDLAVAQERLARRDPREIAERIDRTAALWLAPDSAWMRRAVAELSAGGVWSDAMLQLGLPRMIAPLRRRALDDLVRREIGGWEAIERARTPRLILHVLPSNLAGHAAIPTALTLLLGSAALVKPGRDDRVFSSLWIESMRSIDSDLAACLAVSYWRGGDRAVEDLAMSQVDLVVASGGDDAVEELRRRCPAPLIGHGHRISCAVVGRAALGAESAAALAADVALWDQLGCLSPQVCFVEGSVAAARLFGEEVCEQLASLERSLPPGRMSTGEVLDVRRFCDEAAWNGFATGEKNLFAVSDHPGAGKVAIETAAALRPTPLHRCVRIVPIADVRDLAQITALHRGRVEAVGVAAEADRFAEIAGALAGCGVPQVVPLGQMQAPDLTWRQGGRPRLAEWLHLASQATARRANG